MRLELTEDTKKFINFLSEGDRAKLTFTNEFMESQDDGISDKFREYIKIRLSKVGQNIAETNAKLRVEHPEYFE